MRLQALVRPDIASKICLRSFATESARRRHSHRKHAPAEPL